MQTYHKIHGIFHRDIEKTIEGISSLSQKRNPNYGKFIIGDWSRPEFELLKDIKWTWTEKVNGTNIRVCWNRCPLLPQQLKFKGKTDRADMPKHLGDKLAQLFIKEKMEEVFGSNEDQPDVCLYGEGYGEKINGGGNYFEGGHGVSFILFDIKIGGTFLAREDVEEIADKLAVDVVPIINRGTINEAIEYVKTNPISNISAVRGNSKPMEGLVLRADPELRDRRGKRIILKIKYKDFK